MHISRPVILVFYGPSGSGKSLTANSMDAVHIREMKDLARLPETVDTICFDPFEDLADHTLLLFHYFVGESIPVSVNEHARCNARRIILIFKTHPGTIPQYQHDEAMQAILGLIPRSNYILFPLEAGTKNPLLVK